MTNPRLEKIKPWILQLSLLAMIALAGWFVIRPFLLTLKAEMDAIQKLSVTREYREKQLEKLPDLEGQYALIEAEGKQLDIILTKERLVEFIETLERLALMDAVLIDIESRDNTFLESKVTVAEKTEKKEGAKPAAGVDSAEEPAATPKRGGVKETGIITELPLKSFLKLTITITGEYASVVRYLHRLETLPYALDVIALNVKAHQEEIGDTIASESGVLNPFEATAPVVASVTPSGRLDAVFETVVYMKE
jgi:hypothetical protein